MRCLGLLLGTAALAAAQVQVDNVLLKMVPPGVNSLVGARMDQVRNSPIYIKMLAARKLPELDRFATETGFDPRRDVRELLFVTTDKGGVLLARGSFHVKPVHDERLKTVKHGQYAIQASGESGFCILDSTLAAAGQLPVLEAALDEWKSGGHQAAAPLLAIAKGVDKQTPVWGVSTGFAGFLADHFPSTRNGSVDFSKIFRGLENTWFQADVSKGLRAEVHGLAANDQDAANLRDTAKGLVGFGRLSVPENQPELLKIWDGVTVEQTGRSIVIRADIAQDLLDRLVEMMNAMKPKGQANRPPRNGKL